MENEDDEDSLQQQIVASLETPLSTATTLEEQAEDSSMSEDVEKADFQEKLEKKECTENKVEDGINEVDMEEEEEREYQGQEGESQEEQDTVSGDEYEARAEDEL